MDLKLKEVSTWLKVSEKTIYRWISQEKIPYYRVEHQYRFRREEILNWVAMRNRKRQIPEGLGTPSQNDPIKISSLLERGGIFYRVEGEGKREILRKSLKLIPCSIDRRNYFNALWEREALASTGIGRGIAFPHPRLPLISDARFEAVSICLLETPVEYGAIDGQKVFALFFIQSSALARHLQILYKLGHLCRMDSFVELLKSNPRREVLVEFVKKEEAKWERGKGQ